MGEERLHADGPVIGGEEGHKGELFEFETAAEIGIKASINHTFGSS